MPRVTSLLALVALTTACGAFRAEPIDARDAATDAAPQPDGSLPDALAPDALAPDASPDGGPAVCTPPSCLFRDDFDNRADVKGPWDLVTGTPVLTKSPGARNHLRVDGLSGTDPAPAFLRKTLQGTGAGVEIELGIASETLSGSFGGAVNDYCELVGIELGGVTLAMLYHHRAGVGAWIWADAGQTSGADGGFYVSGLTGPPFSQGRLGVKWIGNRVTMTGGLGGGVINNTQVSFDPARAALPVSVRVGLSCRGLVAGVRLSIDDVVVRAL